MLVSCFFMNEGKAVDGALSNTCLISSWADQGGKDREGSEGRAPLAFGRSTLARPVHSAQRFTQKN